jgi:hypothetical protein
MPVEIDEGSASLKGLLTEEEFAVRYKIAFTTEWETVRLGFPPVIKQSATVLYIRREDGKPIGEGEYLLERPSEINRLKIMDSKTGTF